MPDIQYAAAPALAHLAGLRIWCNWMYAADAEGEKPRKIPYSGCWSRAARSNDPSTWVTLAEARMAAAQLLPGMVGGVGVFLGPLPDGGGWLMGIDYDACVGPEGLEAWALGGLAACSTYCEISPSGVGLKQFALLEDEAAVRRVFGLTPAGDGSHSKSFKLPDRVDHKLGFEICLSSRFFSVTGDDLYGDARGLARFGAAEAERLMADGVTRLMGSRPSVAPLPASRTEERVGAATYNGALAERLASIAELRPKLKRLLSGDTSDLEDNSRSTVAFNVSRELLDAGWSEPDREAVLRGHPATAEWTADKGDAAGGRELRRALARPEGTVAEIGALPAEPGMSSADPPPWKRSAAETRFAPATPAAVDGGNGPWTDRLQIGPNKRPYGNLANARLVLTECEDWKGVVALNRFSGRVTLMRRPPSARDDESDAVSYPRDLRDPDVYGIAAWLQNCGIQIGSAVVHEAAVLVAQDNGFDPVVEWLDGLRWDGTWRIDAFLRDTVGAEDSAYVRAVSAKSLIAAVARAYRPGCKVDTMTILEGEQGIGKSSLLRALFGDEYFSDHLPDIHSKDAQENLQGLWCLEHAEFDKLRRAEISRAKAFITTQVDRFRPSYGRTTENVKRRCVFWGTINPGATGYLEDETGNRRYWPVRCADARIDVERVRAVREQLWAEAVARFKAGENWWLEGDEEKEQAVQADERFSEDSWQQNVEHFLAPLTRATLAEIMQNGIGLPKDRCERKAEVRVGRIMTRMGWKRVRPREGGERTRYYVRPGFEEADHDVVVPFPTVGAPKVPVGTLGAIKGAAD